MLGYTFVRFCFGCGFMFVFFNVLVGLVGVICIEKSDANICVL